MEKCPKCNQYTVGYDAYRKVKRCMVDGCSCIVINKHAYSYLKNNSFSNNIINRVKVENGSEVIIKKYNIG